MEGIVVNIEKHRVELTIIPRIHLMAVWNFLRALSREPADPRTPILPVHATPTKSKSQVKKMKIARSSTEKGRLDSLMINSAAQQGPDYIPYPG
jgi:hypothetical protein